MLLEDDLLDHNALAMQRKNIVNDDRMRHATK